MEDNAGLRLLGTDPLFPTLGNLYEEKNGFLVTDVGGGPFVKKWLNESFEPKSDDVYVVSYPKTGTTWAEEIVYIISNDLDFEKAKSKPLSLRFPFLEYKAAIEQKHVEQLPSPRFIKCHLTLSLLPKAIYDKKCKIIYTIRNPKDTVVSFYHFLKMNKYALFEGDLDTFVDYFVGVKKMGYSPFWLHVLEGWQRRNEDNILVLIYEDMKKDLPKEIKRVASFLGKTLTDEEVLRVAEHCSFKKMKSNPSTNYAEEFGNPQFLRKGEVGDWKNSLTKEMSKKIDDYCEKHLKNSGLKFTYEL